MAWASASATRTDESQYGTRDFEADPIGFMNSCVLLAVPSFTVSIENEGGMHQFVLKKLPALAGRASKNGMDLPLYGLILFNPKIHPRRQAFWAYWCPYKDDDTNSVMLGNAGLYMFTPTMNGCTLGVGNSPSPGVVRAAHANMKAHGGALQDLIGTDKAREQQRITQRNALWKELDSSNISMIEPSQYRHDFDGAMSLTSTTFGVHTRGTAWKFYTQRYWVNGKQHFLRDVIHQI